MAWWKSWKTDWTKVRRLRAAEAGLLLQAVLLLPLTALALRALGFRRWLTTLDRFCPPPPSARRRHPQETARAQTAARLVRAAAVRVAPGDTCLAQAIVLWWLLRRQAIDSDLRLGVRKQSGRLEAHAWIEYRGLALSPAADDVGAYEPFPRFLVPGGGQAA